MTDVLFVCDATPDTGFGHAGRCMQLATLMRRQRPGLRIGFQGTYADSAYQRITSGAPGVTVHRNSGAMPSTLAVIDTMDDTEDPDAWDSDRVHNVSTQARSVAFIANGTRAPKLDAGITCIGYQPGDAVADPPRVFWGLEYAPVSSAALTSAPIRRSSDRALVALGGAKDDHGLNLALGALAQIEQIAHIDILQSPVAPFRPNPAHLRPGQTFSLHANVPTVQPLLSAATLVVASYGHLGYEALAAGAPLCLLAQKLFQEVYADRLEELGLAISAGRAGECSTDKLALACAQTLESAQTLSRRARSVVDGRGIDRIASILLAKLQAA